MKKYQIIRADTIRGLTEFVNNEIKHGWKVTGGLAAAIEHSQNMLGPDRTYYLQAMIHDTGNNVHDSN